MFFDGGFFPEIQVQQSPKVEELSFRSQKCGSSRPQTFKDMEAIALNAQTYGSSHFRRPEVWELSLCAANTMGALALKAQKYGSSHFKRPRVWEL